MEKAPPLTFIEAQLPGHGDGLGGNGLAGLHQVDVLDLQHSPTGGGRRAHSYDLGIHAALASVDQLGHGLHAVLLHRLAAGQHDGGRAVAGAGGVASSDLPIRFCTKYHQLPHLALYSAQCIIHTS